MRHSGWQRAVAMGLALLLVQGCASVPHEGRSGSSRPGRAVSPGEATLVSLRWSAAASEEEGSAEDEAGRAEVEWALARMWAVARAARSRWARSWSSPCPSGKRA